MAGAWIPLPGYPTAAWGQTKVWRGDHVGPANYATGGEIPVPGAFGFPGGIEEIGAGFGGYSYSNNYYVKMFPPVAAGNTFNVNESFAPVWPANASNANNTNQIQIVWYYAANNVQVAANTTLAAEGVRITAYGG